MTEWANFKITDTHDELRVEAFGIVFAARKRMKVPQPERDDIAWMGVGHCMVKHMREKHEAVEAEERRRKANR